MAAKGKVQVKLYLTPEAHDVLRRASAATKKSHSVVVEELVFDVLEPELKKGA